MKLIVLAAFDRDDETGELRPAFEARECRDEDQAKRQQQRTGQQPGTAEIAP